jgi:hypothetical protein
VEDLRLDPILTEASGVVGASIYCLDTASGEFRVTNYALLASTSEFVPLDGLSFRLKSIGTAAFSRMAESVLPKHGYNPIAVLFVHHLENDRFVPKHAPFEYSNTGDDDGYRLALTNYTGP